MDVPRTGYTPAYRPRPATKEQLVALRDLLLSHGDKHAAAAVDNVIDILTVAASDPRTPAEIDADERDADWHEQVADLLAGMRN